MKLDYKEVLKESYECFKRNIKLILIAVGVEYIIWFSFKVIQVIGENALKNPNTTSSQSVTYFMASLGIVIVGVFVSYFINPLLIIAIVNREYTAPAPFSTLVTYIFKSYPYLIGTVILTSMVNIGGYLLLIIPGIIFSCMFSQAYYLTLIDGLSPIQALKQSKLLTRFNKMRIYNTYFLISIMSIVFIPLSIFKVPDYITQIFVYILSGYMVVLGYTIFKKLISFQVA